MINIKTKKAFTLIEALVAISILVMSVVAPLTIVAQSMFQARYSKDQVTAIYLAQEAVEMIRYVRDRNMMQNLLGAELDWLDRIPTNVWISPGWADARDGSFRSCPGNNPKSCQYLKYQGAYNLNLGDSTKFKRAVKVIKSTNNQDEAQIVSRVYWISGAVGERYVEVKSYIYNWARVEDNN